MANDNEQLKKLDIIYDTASKLDKTLESVTKKFTNLTETAIKASANMSSTLRNSSELTEQGSTSAANEIQNIISKSDAIAKLTEQMQKQVEAIKDVNNVSEVPTNFENLVNNFAALFENLQKAGASYEQFSTKLMSAPDTTKAISRDMAILSDSINDAFASFNKAANDMPKGQETFDMIVQSMQDSYTSFSTVIKAWSKDFGDSFDVINRKMSAPVNSEQLFSMLNNGLDNLAAAASVGRDNIVDLFESVDRGADVSKIKDLYREISDLKRNTSFELASSSGDPEKMLELQEKIVGKYKEQLQIMSDITQQNAGKFNVEQMLEVTNKMREAADYIKQAGQASHIVNQSTKNPKDFDYIGEGNAAKNHILNASAFADIDSNYDNETIYNNFLTKEMEFLRRSGGRVGITGHSQKLKKHAGVLEAQQMGGLNVGIDAEELSKSADKIQGLEYKRNRIQTEFDRALSKGDRDTAKTLVPHMAKLQMDIDNEVVGLNKFIPSKKDLKNLPEEVSEMVTTISTILKNAKSSNQTLMSIAVATDKEGLRDTIEQLNNVNNKIKEISNNMDDSTNKFTSGIQNMQSWYSKGANILNSGTRLMGLGSMVGIASTVQNVMGQHKNQGQLEKDMALAEFAGYGAGHNNDLFNSLYESGLGSQKNTNGIIQAEDYTKNFINYTRNVQGQYGSVDDPTAMADFGKTSALMQKAFNVSDSTVMQGINTFYKELKISSADVNAELLKMGTTAEQLNIPFEKYLQQVSSLAINFRNIGIDGKNAESVIANLIRGGMSNDTAMAYASGMGSAVTRTTPGMMAYSGMMSGNYGNFYDAVAGGQMLWDSKGDVNQGNVARLADSIGWYGDMMGGAFGGAGHDMIMMQSLTGQLGMSQKEASMTLSKMNDGENLRDILSMFYSNEGSFDTAKPNEVTEGQKMLETALSKASDNLSGIDKSLNAYDQSIKKLAHTNEDSLRSTTDISKIIYSVGNKLDSLTDALNSNNVALIALIAALALGPGTIAKLGGGLLRGGKNLLTGGGAAAGAGAAGKGGKSLWQKMFGKGGAEAATKAEQSAAKGFMSKIPSVKGGGLLGLGLLGATFLPELFDMFGGDSSPDSSTWMNQSTSPYAPNPYLNGMTGTGTPGTPNSNYNPYANIDQYSVNADSLGGQSNRFLQNTATVGLAGLSLLSGPVGWTALGLGLGNGMFGDDIFGTSEEAIMKKYGSGLDSKAKNYQDYIYQQTGGQQVDNNFSYVAAKGMDIGKDLLLGRSTDEQMQFGTAYAKAIAEGKDSNSALMTAQRALEGNEKLQSIGRESVQNAIQSLLVQKDTGVDISTMLREEMPKNAEEEKRALEKIATVTGTKMDELKKAITDSGLTTAQVIAQMRQDGSMTTVEKNASVIEKKEEIDSKIQDMIDHQMGYYKKEDKETATQAYLQNKDIINSSNLKDSEMVMWLKTVVNQTKAGKSNEDSVDKANDYIARYRSGLDVLEKGDLAGYVQKFDQSKLGQELPSAHLQNGSRDSINAFASEMGVPWETMTEYIKKSGVSSDNFERALKFLSDDWITKQTVNTKDPGFDMLLNGFEEINTKQKKELEDLNKKQDQANEYLKTIANNSSTMSTETATAAATAGNNLLTSMIPNLGTGNAAASAALMAAGGGSNTSSSGGGGTTASGPASPTDVRGASGLTAEQLNKQLGGALAGHGQDFLNAEKVSGVSAAILAAISMHETGNGTSKAVNDSRHNVGGMMKKTGGQMSFSSVSESIDYFGKYIKRMYIDDGLTSVASIQKRYAPHGAGNDPNNLNVNWQGGVSKYWSGLTGKAAPATPSPATPAATNITTANQGTVASPGQSSDPAYDFASAYFGPIDAGVGPNSAFSGIGDVNAKTKYASNIYGRGYTTLASGMYNTQEISLKAGNDAKKIEHNVAVNITADKLVNDPTFIKELTTAFEEVAKKSGAKIKKEVAEQLAKTALSKLNN